jgi:putative nucleotidyltransferase with HDIG domain
MTQTNSNYVVDDYTKYILLDYRQKLLRVLLVACIIILLGLTIFNLMSWLPVTLIRWEGFSLAAGIAIIVLLILLWMNQRGHVALVGWIFCLFVFVSIFVSYSPSRFSQALLIMALPVAVSSLIIQPWTSFLFAGLTIMIYMWTYLQSGKVSDLDSISIAALLILTIGAYVVSKILNKSISDSVRAYDETIQGWANALEMRDSETMGHSQRVVNLTLSLARKLGIQGPDLVHARRGVLLHDIGKMGIPDSILHKHGALTEDEWEVMRKHPEYARDYFSGISYLTPAMDIPFFHHEKWDGTGYPHGLQGEHIPLPARIFAVVDVWDALTSDRPYREAWTNAKTLKYIQEQAGKHFDPRVVDIFTRLIEKQK